MTKTSRFKPMSDFNPRTPRGVRPGPPWSPCGPAGDISIHAPREGCDMSYTDWVWVVFPISIHAPREGCDMSYTDWVWVVFPISIHAPREGCDYETIGVFTRESIISIHAPREGCDAPLLLSCLLDHDFNPRTPRGVRPGWCPRCPPQTPFQSTHPARGATISSPVSGSTRPYFNPRTPRGVRPSASTVSPSRR